MPITLPYSAKMTDKRALLASELTTVLAAHEAGWTVSERYDLGKERGSKADRTRVMGSPIRYCRVAHVGRASRDAASSDVYGAARQTAHVFAVYLWREYDDTDASQTLWDAILEGHDPDGVLVHLDGLGGLENATGEVIYVFEPEDVICPDEPLYMGDDQYCWYCQFFITLT